MRTQQVELKPGPSIGHQAAWQGQGSLPSLASVGANMDLWVNGSKVGNVVVNSTSEQSYSFSLPLIASGSRVDVAFTNDGSSGTEDRNLFVSSIAIGNSTILPTASTVRYDLGSSTNAFDGLNVIAGQVAMPWNGALRFFAP